MLIRSRYKTANTEGIVYRKESVKNEVSEQQRIFSDLAPSSGQVYY